MLILIFDTNGLNYVDTVFGFEFSESDNNNN